MQIRGFFLLKGWVVIILVQDLSLAHSSAHFAGAAVKKKTHYSYEYLIVYGSFFFTENSVFLF